jgi:fatty-acid desaturase
MSIIEKINPLWFYRIVRLIFALLFFAVGYFYEDGWPAYIFAGIIFITIFFKPTNCVGAQCEKP